MLPARFRLLASHWLSGVAVVTSMGDDGCPTGLTMSAVTSLSLSPPQFLICVDGKASTLPAIQASGNFCINYLGKGQEHLAVLFARKAEDKFAGVPYRTIETGAPVLDDVIAFVECAVHAIYPGGDHCIIVGNVVHGEAQGGEPLGHYRGEYR
jgi:flavin reductase (DIM6/NTAB) family NADH-FMN oxidoreductase RutF